MQTDEQLKECLEMASGHYKALEAAKEDCEVQVDAAITAYVSQSGRRVTKLDKKNIANIAKAIATGKTSDLKAEVESFISLMNSSEIEGGIQLDLFGFMEKAGITDVQ